VRNQAIKRNSYLGYGEIFLTRIDISNSMGIFGDSNGNSRYESLVNSANGDSVTEGRLTETSPSLIGKDLMATEPVMNYLETNEQPHYFLFNDTKGITKNGSTAGGGSSDASYRSLCVVTDQRLLFFAAGSRGESLPIGAITDVNTGTGHMKHRLTVGTLDNEYTFYINNTINGEEVKECGEYIEIRAREIDSDASDSSVIDGLSSLWDAKLDQSPSADDALSADPQGSYVTRDRYEKIKGILDPEEQVHFITRGSTVDVEGSSAGSSLFGDNRSRKSGTRGYVRAVITDKRVAVKIPQMLGTDERSVSYNSITSVDLDTGLVNKRLTLQTPGQTYHIEAHEPGKDEVRRAIRFIRQKVEKTNQPDVIQQQSDESEPDALEKLEKLKELNDSGAISDEEFDDKKQELLDEI
jgi:hypothetical protein